MKMPSLAKLRKEMEKALEPKRYEHTLSVAYTAANLAMVHDIDIDKALTAGMLHDCAKCLSHHKQVSICKKSHMALSEMESEDESPLIHAKAGSILAREEYGIEDEDILNAICYHTTGRPQMSPLEKVIYIADYIEPGRKHAKRTAGVSDLYLQNLTDARKLAYKDLDEALCRILSDTLAYLKEKGGKVDSMTQKTYEYYKYKSHTNEE
ncbi:MAG: bis(5'-nucleosyl)-tetraphosphatase (symmetrical) YqeK [Lachnospiraceae bacterium]|nr:bis(5'-nucleosyl)-tetraphosphatase (symmetrical) YqeK [Lachnospiraceae bacterium]